MRSPVATKRFQREVRAAAQLEHPNIVTAFDADEDGGVQFLVMQYVEGTSLSALVKEQGPLPIDLAISCILQAARGLEYAHNRGVVHRDVKPGNLILDGDGTVKLLDLGLARIESLRREAGDYELTDDGDLLGTVDFMAPEQAASLKNADRRSDIYSLGFTLWYLLTGREGYSGESKMERLLAHREQPIPSLREARPHVSRTLEAVFAKMVAKRPEDRYQTMTEVITELERSRTSEAAAATHPIKPVSDTELSGFLRLLADQEPSSKGSAVRSAVSTKSKTSAPTSAVGEDSTSHPDKPESSRSRQADVAATEDPCPSSSGRSAKYRRWPRKARLAVAVSAVSVLLVCLLIWAIHGPLETPAENNGPQPPDVASKGKPLFDGKSLTGWKVIDDGEWTVQDGVLKGKGEGGWLQTENSYGDFDLLVEYRLAKGGDSGVFLRIGPKLSFGGKSNFLELQLVDDLDTDVKWRTGSLVDRHRRIGKVDATTDEWHAVIVETRGLDVRVWFDGRLVNEYDLSEYDGLGRPDAQNISGSIGLEACRHGVEFRNVKLHPFPAEGNSE
jgi:serine/threonine protein kinase